MLYNIYANTILLFYLIKKEPVVRAMRTTGVVCVWGNHQPFYGLVATTLSICVAAAVRLVVAVARQVLVQAIQALADCHCLQCRYLGEPKQ